MVHVLRSLKVGSSSRNSNSKNHVQVAGRPKSSISLKSSWSNQDLVSSVTMGGHGAHPAPAVLGREIHADPKSFFRGYRPIGEMKDELGNKPA